MDVTHILRFIIVYAVPIGLTVAAIGALIIGLPYLLKFQRRWIYIVTTSVGSVILIVSVAAIIIMRIYTTEFRDAFIDVHRGLNQAAPDVEFVILSPDSTAAALSDFTGRVVVLNFWATWCPPCIHEMPDLSRLAEGYREEVAVLCISDETTDRIERWLGDFEPLEQYIGVLASPGDIPPYYSIIEQGRPITFYIDKDGRLRNYTFGALTYEAFVRNIEPYL